MSLLKTNAITMQFGGLTAVNELNLSIDQGEIVAVIGPNGAGKTTAFNMITGVYTPTKGTIQFNDHDITGLKPHLITRQGMARTFQNIRLFKDLTVEDNIFIAQHLHLKSNLYQAMFRLPGYQKEEKLILEKVTFLLEKVGLADLSQEKASSLPYGLQRKLEIARALATDPQLLLLDEPAAGLNPKETSELDQLILQLRDKHDISVLLIEHDMGLVMGISDHITVINQGAPLADGTPLEVRENPDVIKAYLGES